MEVNAKRQGSDHAVTCTYEFGENLKEACELFGDDVVYSKFKAAAVIDLQGVMRRAMFKEEGEGDDKVLVPVDQEDVQKVVDDWKPGVSNRVVRTPKERALAALKGMSPEDIKALLADLDEDEDEAAA